MRNNKLVYSRLILSTFLLSAIFTISFSSCYKLKFFHDTELLREKYDGEILSTSTLLSNDINSDVANIGSACPSGASLVEVEQSILNGFTYYFSLGFYNSYTVRIWCKRRKK